MQFDGLKRRAFITLLGGTAAWPLVASAQPSAMPVIGYLRSESFDGTAQRMIAGFREGLKEGGYIDGQNVAIEIPLGTRPARSVTGTRGRSGSPSGSGDRRQCPCREICQGNHSNVADCFRLWRRSGQRRIGCEFNHPGGNVTGVTFLGGLVGGRRVQLLHDLTPQAGVIALLIDANNITSAAELSDLEGAVHAIGLNRVVGKVASELEIDSAFATFAQQHAGALVVGNSPFFTSHIKRIVALAARNALPASYQQREFAEVGGLMSYGSSLSDAYRQAGIYAAHILKGERPADLPVVQTTKFELVVNLKAAKALGIEVPPQVLALADEVIE